MADARISTITPVYNGERYLKEAIDSILSQTYQPAEILVVDDGSTDKTAEIVTGYGTPVRYLWQPNAGAVAAMNRGLSAATGDFIAFLHADDLWHPEKLARQVACFDSRSELDLCISHLQHFWMPELSEEAAQLQNHRWAEPIPGYAGGALLARRSLFTTVGLFNATLQHRWDFDWFLRAADAGAVMELLPDVFMYHRLHRTNLSRHGDADSRDEYLQILKASLDHRRRLHQARPPAYAFPTSKPNDLKRAG